MASAGGDCASHVRPGELLSILSGNSATRSLRADPDGAHAGMKVLLFSKAFEVKGNGVTDLSENVITRGACGHTPRLT